MALVAFYGIIHAIIDGTCAGIIFNILNKNLLGFEQFVFLVIIYNLLAFGTQAIFGLFIDKYKIPKQAAAIACIFLVVSVLIHQNFIILAIILAGLGNAIFHVGGGSISITQTPHRATGPGIFVAPGALGLTLGILIGKNGLFMEWVFVVLLLISFILIILSKAEPVNNFVKKLSIKSNILIPTLILLLVTIATRALYGLSASFPWKSNIILLIVFAAALVGGKALGGILADKLGWMRVAISVLLISAPLLAFTNNIPALAILGAFLFQMTMPITLTAIANVLPGRPAFSFGLACLALIIGAVPALFGFKAYLSGQWQTLFFILGSAIVIYFGLKNHNKIMSFLYIKN